MLYFVGTTFIMWDIIFIGAFSHIIITSQSKSYTLSKLSQNEMCSFIRMNQLF